MNLFVVLLLITAAFAKRLPRQILHGKCYDFQTPIGLDLNKWANGKWYEIQRYDNEFEKDASCATHVYFLDSEKKEIDITFGMMYKNSTIILQGKANYTTLESEIALEATFPDDTTASTFDVVATDIEKYSIVYSCVQTLKDPSLPEKQERLWILSRTSALDNETMVIVNEALQINGTDLTRYFDNVIQEDCP